MLFKNTLELCLGMLWVEQSHTMDKRMYMFCPFLYYRVLLHPKYLNITNKQKGKTLHDMYLYHSDNQTWSNGDYRL